MKTKALNLLWRHLVNMKNIFLTLNNVQTHIITWGDPFHCDGKDVIICISGNPGIPDFYTLFGSLLHESTKLPVCVIGQAGHEDVPDKKSNELKGQEHLFDLKGQIQHKQDLITKHIDEQSKIHLIGHSIGSWLILELLHKNEKVLERVSSVNLLFPTVQKMAESKSGMFLNNIMRKVHAFTMILCMLIYVIPESIKRIIVRLYIKLNGIPQHFDTGITKFCNPKVIEKVLFLAYNEMDNVKALNIRSIEKIKDKTYVLYSPRDGWAPIHYMDDFRPFEPALSLKEVDVEHAFVLKSSERIAEMVSDFVKSKITHL